MDINFIERVAQIAKNNDLTVIDIKLQESELHIERNHSPVVPANRDTASFETSNIANISDKIPDFDEVSANENQIKSPMVGVFYSSPSPDSQPYVKVGDSVKAGDVLCIVEAMKLMNEIESKFDGKVKSIRAVDGDVVEYGQTLFTIG